MLTFTDAFIHFGVPPVVGVKYEAIHPVVDKRCKAYSTNGWSIDGRRYRAKRDREMTLRDDRSPESEITDLTGADAVFYGEEATMRAGIDVALADVNDVGTDDIVIGAQRARGRVMTDGGGTNGPLSQGDFRYIIYCAGDIDGEFNLREVGRREER